MKLNKRLSNFLESSNFDNPIQKVSCFDLDHTLLSQNCCYAFGVYLYRQGFLSFTNMLYSVFCYFLHKRGIFSIVELQKKIFDRCFLGYSEPVIKAKAKVFFETHLNEILYLPAVAQLKEAQNAQQYTIILSSSPGFLVELIAEKLGVNTWAATNYTIDEDHCFCAIESFMLSDDKAFFIELLANRLKLSKQAITAYSDSILDLSFLQAAGHAVAVNPDPALHAHCLQNNWPII